MSKTKLRKEGNEVVSFTNQLKLKASDGKLKGQKQKLKGKKKFTLITLSEESLETIEFLSLDCTSAEITSSWQSDFEILINKLGYVRKNGIDTQELWDGTITSIEKPLRLKIRNICGDETVCEISSKKEKDIFFLSLLNINEIQYEQVH